MVATTSIFLSSGNSVKDSTSTLSMCCLSINEISFLIAGAVIKTGFLFSFFAPRRRGSRAALPPAGAECRLQWRAATAPAARPASSRPRTGRLGHRRGHRLDGRSRLLWLLLLLR